MSDIVVGNNVEAAVIEAYWMPGCTSCLRMKEFLEKSGKPWKSINLAEEPTAIDKLKPFGVGAPAVAVGDRVVQGLDLVGIAELIGWDEYDPPVMLTPAELDAKYRIVLDGLIRFTGQLNDETVAYRAQENNRAIRFLVAHAGSIMRYGIDAYDLDAFDNGAPRRGRSPTRATLPTCSPTFRRRNGSTRPGGMTGVSTTPSTAYSKLHGATARSTRCSNAASGTPRSTPASSRSGCRRAWPSRSTSP
jgi:hypothetical protein